MLKDNFFVYHSQTISTISKLHTSRSAGQYFTVSQEHQWFPEFLNISAYTYWTQFRINKHNSSNTHSSVQIHKTISLLILNLYVFINIIFIVCFCTISWGYLLKQIWTNININLERRRQTENNVPNEPQVVHVQLCTPFERYSKTKSSIFTTNDSIDTLLYNFILFCDPV